MPYPDGYDLHAEARHMGVDTYAERAIAEKAEAFADVDAAIDALDMAYAALRDAGADMDRLDEVMKEMEEIKEYYRMEAGL